MRRRDMLRGYEDGEERIACMVHCRIINMDDIAVPVDVRTWNALT